MRRMVPPPTQIPALVALALAYPSFANMAAGSTAAAIPAAASASASRPAATAAEEQPALAATALRPAPAARFHTHWFALDIDGGGGGRAGDGWLTFLRLRAGYANIAQRRILSLVATAETHDLDRLAFGVQGDVRWIDLGLGAYLGPTVSSRGRLGITAGVGWSLLAAECQVLFDELTRVVILVGVRLPLGALAYALWGPPDKYTMGMPEIRERR